MVSVDQHNKDLWRLLLCLFVCMYDLMLYNHGKLLSYLEDPLLNRIVPGNVSQRQSTRIKCPFVCQQADNLLFLNNLKRLFSTREWTICPGQSRVTAYEMNTLPAELPCPVTSFMFISQMTSFKNDRLDYCVCKKS